MRRIKHGCGVKFVWLAVGLLAAGCGKEPSSERASVAKPAATPNIPEIEELRHSIDGGQVILADDPALARGEGWLPPDFDLKSETKVTCWTTGDLQTVQWSGPDKPGDYEITAHFWRHHPFPEQDLVIPFRIAGGEEWASAPAPLGAVELKGTVTTTTSREPLRFESKIPSWVPEKLIPGSNDPRSLGMMFTRIEVRPAGQEQK